MSENYYEILQVSPQASSAVIKAAYKAMAQQYHPDNYHDNGVMMRKVNEAYDVLNDPARRKKYDELVFPKAKPDYPERKEETAKKTNETRTEEARSSTGATSENGREKGGLFGFIILLLIIGMFTGHTKMLFTTAKDWVGEKLETDKSDRDRQEDDEEYVVYLEFDYMKQKLSYNDKALIFVDGEKIGEIKAGENESIRLQLSGNQHTIWLKSDTMIRHNNSSKVGFVIDDRSIISFAIMDDSIWGLTIKEE